mmetsp:Transcript_6660/g.24694  ORF Transcript_6660/g.24694 Transcript_6660/m.24694 type:complete len:254 (-) Transcript_6660:1826-2587(-)
MNGGLARRVEVGCLLLPCRDLPTEARRGWYPRREGCRGCQTRHICLPSSKAMRPEDASTADRGDSFGAAMMRQFMRMVNEDESLAPRIPRRPSPLLSPCAAIQAQMECLMRNNYPDENAGLRSAFDFSMPFEVDRILVGQTHLKSKLSRSWCEDGWVGFEDFALQLQTHYSPLIECMAWEFASELRFVDSERDIVEQDVRVLVEKACDLNSTRGANHEPRCQHVYRIVLEKVTCGAYSGIWLTTRVHQLGCFV